MIVASQFYGTNIPLYEWIRNFRRKFIMAASPRVKTKSAAAEAAA